MGGRRTVRIFTGLAVSALVGALVIWYIFGTPGDGWTRADEAAHMERCTSEDGFYLTESSCQCLQDYWQAQGVTYEELQKGVSDTIGMPSLIECEPETADPHFTDLNDS